MIRAGAISIPFTYAAGEAGSRFLAALRDEQMILGARCVACDRVYCPGRAVCPRCGAADLAWAPVGPAGTVVAWTHLPAKGSYALVRLDGASTALLHHLMGDPAQYAVGARVHARFAVERTGSILDLAGFAPGEGAA